MKIVFDTKTGLVKYGKKPFEELDSAKKVVIESNLRKFLRCNTMMSDYESDCMWMSYRYCVGRHTIASHAHAEDIWKNCRGRMSNERQLFTAYDINREIEQHLTFGYNFPSFYFPITSLNRIYTPAVDIVCDFIEQYNITSKEELCKYKEVHVILSNNDAGYKLEVVTWEEYLRAKIHMLLSDYFNNDSMSVDYAWEYFETWKNEKFEIGKDLKQEFEKIINEMPNPELCYMHDFEDLFVWNDLVHCFDNEHHHKSILTDGEEVEWFWTYMHKSEQKEDGYWYKTFGYKKIRVPLNEWNGVYSTYIPDESIKEDIY